MWAMKDIAFTPELVDQLWLNTFPDAEVERIADAGHYLQEDAHERIVPAAVARISRALDLHLEVPHLRHRYRRHPWSTCRR